MKSCKPHEIARWKSDFHRVPPYQYKDENCLWRSTGEARPPNVEEREAILGFPIGFTKQCVAKSLHGAEGHRDCRLTLLGNAWSVPVVCWLLSSLFHVLGFTQQLTIQGVVDRLAPGKSQYLQGLLLRPPMCSSTTTLGCSELLVRKLCGLVSLRGEDLMLQHGTDLPVRHHRLRQSLPGRLWHWRTVAGWRWTDSSEHINVLELRAVLITIRWRIERLHQQDIRCLHLLDSLVVLHALSRGRSSSRKMRRTLMRLNSYLLVLGLQPIWAYIDTHQNPADTPSRRGVKKKFLKKTLVVKSQTKQGRKEPRKKMGTLKSLTVQPRTKECYQAGLQRFYAYLQKEGLLLPYKHDLMDPLVADYIEYLWADGEGRATASNFLAALQDSQPRLKGLLLLSWRLMKAWTTNEVPNRAPPMTEAVLKAMAGWSFFLEEHKFGLNLLVGFYGLLRTGDLLSLQAWQIHMISPNEPAVISLGFTKSDKRQGAAESVTLTELPVLQLLWKWTKSASSHALLTPKPHVWRQLFQSCLEGVKVNGWGFRPYSLRRGGATSFFVKVGSLDRVLLLGRWTALKTAKIYLNSGLAMLAELKIAPHLLRPFHLVFTISCPLIKRLSPLN